MKKTISTAALLVLVFAFVTYSCKKEKIQNAPSSSNPAVAESKVDYPVSSNDHLAALGRVLFYDKNLSHNNSIACASCHQQSRAFCDNQKSSSGLNDVGSTRNTPGIFAKKTRVFWDGRALGLRDLVLRPLANHAEMGVKDFDLLTAKLRGIEYYPEMFDKAFNTPGIDSTKIKEALTEFLNNFMFSNNKFRRSRLGGEALSATELLGKELFFGKATCSNCHNIVIDDPGASSPYSDGTDFSFTASHNIGLDEIYKDHGIAGVTMKPEDEGKFMMPVLLNVEYTYPYMHDSRFATLEEVVEHYNSGIKDHPNLDIKLRDFSAYPGKNPLDVFTELDKNKNGMLEKSESVTVPPIKLNLTESEKRYLVAFLKTLTDGGIKTDKRFSDPFRQ